MAIRYVKRETTPLFENAAPEIVGRKKKDPRRYRLLWGDRVEVLEEQGTRTRVRARGKGPGWVETEDLGDTSLLELYFIDVGQGDGVLIRTPDDRHILIDGGWPRHSQPTGKNAADFVDWKFARDYRAKQILLDAVICSHNDQDHYGGLWDLLNPEMSDELDLKDVRVESFFHAGLSWWKGAKRTLGTPVSTPHGKMYTQLLSDRAAALEALGPEASPALQGEWGEFIGVVTGARRRDGSSTPMTRLGTPQGEAPVFLPGFGPENGPVTIRVLAPVEFDVQGETGIRFFKGGDSKNTNGNSVLLRLDYGKARILLTGDLNSASQNALLDDYAGRHGEFECDVAKSCHHGSDDISFKFMETLKPAATIISSGDNEGHDHPRPAVVATSALTGFKEMKGDRLVTPLVYSTELARSVRLGTPSLLEVLDGGAVTKTYNRLDFEDMRVTSHEVLAAAREPKTVRQSFSSRRVMTGLIYGLVNVRTDGKKILCATLDEAEDDWRIETFKARF
jgi:beta-lactamase superfamily II metal-dependent hydrolase